ncbi:MAG: chemotaxis protein CheW [Candidatus Thiodiazotropha sp.]
MAELITGYGVEREQHLEHVEEEVRQYLTFLIEDKTYAVGILEVNEIIEVSEMTDVPMMPDFLRGVINLRGDVVPVIDLACRMQRGSVEITKRSCIVLVTVPLSEEQRQAVGLLVDSVNEIVEIQLDHIMPPPQVGEGIDTRFIEAMGRVDERFIILLSIDHILTRDQLGKIEALSGQDWQSSESE